MTESTAVADVVAAVQTSRRYQWVAPAVIARLAAEEVPKSRTAAEAQKRTKRRLHQIFGAYTQPLPYATIAARLANTDRRALTDFCRWVLGLHASTRERLPILDEFFPRIFERTGQPASVLDVACGLNPFAAPWMPLTSYDGFDIDSQLIQLADTFLSALDIPHTVAVRDALTAFEPEPADVALVLKTLPNLEQQLPGASRTLLEQLNARWLVVSYPTRSLGGRTKGMARTYGSHFTALVKDKPWQVHELAFANELVFVVDTQRQ